jgi:hypothetical protein
MGYNIHQKLPLPMHPLSWGTPDREWYSFRGWIPAVWFDDVKKYDEWGDAKFKSDSYSTPKVINDIAVSLGWLEDMVKYGNVRPRPEDDPEWQAFLKKNYANVPEWWIRYRNEHGFETKEEYDKLREQTAVTVRAAHAADKERIRKKRAAVRDKIKVQEQAREDAAAKKAAVEQLEREMPTVVIAGASANDPADGRTPRPSRRRSRSIDVAGQSMEQVNQHSRSSGILVRFRRQRPTREPDACVLFNASCSLCCLASASSMDVILRRRLSFASLDQLLRLVGFDRLLLKQRGSLSPVTGMTACRIPNAHD